MPIDKLTIKQEKYAQNLFAGLSQREAYKQAYNCENMKDETIDRNAHELAKDNKIATRIQQLTDELKGRNMVTAEKVMAEFAHIAFDDISNYLEYKTVKTVVGYEDGEPIMDYRPIIDLKDSSKIDTRNIAEVSIGPNGTFKFKQYCKDNALLQLGKMLGMFTEKIESHNINENVELSSEERKKKIEELETIRYGAPISELLNKANARG